MNVAVIFGGKSSEHDISIITAVQAMAALSRKHECVPVYIDSGGTWLVGKNFDKLSTFSEKIRGKEVHSIAGKKAIFLKNGKRYKQIDAALMCLHGMGGEDGTVAGVLELAGIPYTGSNLRASAVGMDKITLKHVLAGLGLPVTKYLGLDKYEYTYNLFDITEKIKTEFAFPLIVKPSNLGSSIGISRANDFVELIEALNVAFRWDSRVIIEEALTDFTELNCAVLGYGNEYIVSEIEQPIGWTDFLTFNDKYEGGFKGTSSRKFPAEIDEDIRNTVRSLALKTFRAIDAAGVARVDFLLKDGTVYVNEINTIPGSLSNYLFTHNNLNFCDLIEKMLDYAICARRDKNSLKYVFERKELLKNSAVTNGKLDNRSKLSGSKQIQ